MATATLDSSNANKRFMILAVVLGLLGAILVFAAVSRGGSSGGGSGSAADVAIVVARSDIAARSRITADMLDVKRVPASTVSEFAFTDPTQVVGQVTRFPIVANEQVLSSKVIAAASSSNVPGVSRALSYTIPVGKRAISIDASQVQNAGGLVLPGDYVDILVVYNVQFGDDTEDNYLVQTLMQNVEVLAIQQTIFDTVSTAEVNANGQRTRNTEAAPNPDASVVTLAVSPDDAQKLYLADMNGEIRFALRSFGDGEQKPVEFLVEPDLLPQNIPAPAGR